MEGDFLGGLQLVLQDKRHALADCGTIDMQHITVNQAARVLEDLTGKFYRVKQKYEGMQESGLMWSDRDALVDSMAVLRDVLYAPEVLMDDAIRLFKGEPGQSVRKQLESFAREIHENASTLPKHKPDVPWN